MQIKALPGRAECRSLKWIGVGADSDRGKGILRDIVRSAAQTDRKPSGTGGERGNLHEGLAKQPQSQQELSGPLSEGSEPENGSGVD